MKAIVSETLIMYIFLSFAAPMCFCDDTIHGHYCYTYGDNESLKEARERTKSLAIRDAIESYRVFVESMTTVDGFTLTDDLIQTISSGYLKNIRTIEHTEKGRTVCYTIQAIVAPSEIESIIKRQTNKRDRMAAYRKHVSDIEIVFAPPVRFGPKEELEIVVGLSDKNIKEVRCYYSYDDKLSRYIVMDFDGLQFYTGYLPEPGFSTKQIKYRFVILNLYNEAAVSKEIVVRKGDKLEWLGRRRNQTLSFAEFPKKLIDISEGGFVITID